MKCNKILIITLLTALFIAGCGTTVNESLGDPPVERPKEQTSYPAPNSLNYHKDTTEDSITIEGYKNCVESGALVIVSDSTDTNVLNKATADSSGSFKIKIDGADIEGVMIRAQAYAKAASTPVGLFFF